jgi:hypothetical protein
MKNKLDSFNKNKIKCKKCKEYFDKTNFVITFGDWLCKDCSEKWFQFRSKQPISKLVCTKIWIDFLDEQN